MSAVTANGRDVVPAEGVVLVHGPLQAVAAAALLVACCALVALTVVQVWQVVTRYVLDSPAAWISVRSVMAATTLRLRTPRRPRTRMS